MALNKYFVENIEKLGKEIKYIREQELPRVEEALDKATEMLFKVDDEKRDARVKIRYIREIEFYERQKRLLEMELNDYMEEQRAITVKALHQVNG